MTSKKITKDLDFSLDRREISALKKDTKVFVEVMQKHLLKKKIDADVFVGGSLAKGTLMKAKEYDVDVFVRFDWKYEDLSKELEKVVGGASKELGIKLEKLHGSRDYFRMQKNSKLVFEIIPVLRIKNIREARNVTDLSYFHVKYIRKRMAPGMEKELGLLKAFSKALKVYGAETYINGFSGYGLECLIIHYKTFKKTLMGLVKVKAGGRLVIDPAKHFSKKDDVFFELNESKISGPLVLIDPTWKERNVLASLNRETFERFQIGALKFLENPSEDLFVEFDVDPREIERRAKKRKGEFLHIVLKTDRQEGDIAGTKMKKFAKFITNDLKKYYTILDKDFSYSGRGKTANYYLVLKSKGEVAKIGPPLEMKESVKKFRSKNKDLFEKNGMLHARILVDFSGKDYLKKFKENSMKKVKEMGITSFIVG